MKQKEGWGCRSVVSAYLTCDKTPGNHLKHCVYTHTPKQNLCSGVTGFRPVTSKFSGAPGSELGATFRLSVDMSQWCWWRQHGLS